MAGARARGLAVGCGIQVAAIAWLLLVCGAFALAWPALPAAARPFVVPLALATWVCTTLPAVATGGVIVTLRRNARLDRAFAELGPGRALAPVARGWACLVNGREVNAWFSKGPQLELYVSARPRTQAGIGKANALSRMVVGATGRASVPAPHGLLASGVDPAWLAAFLDARGVSDALGDLLAHGDGLRNVQVLPDAVKFTQRGFDLDALDAREVGRLVDAVELLAAAADKVPPTASPVAPGGLGARLRTSRGGFGSFLAITLGLTTALVALVVLVSLVLMLAAR